MGKAKLLQFLPAVIVEAFEYLDNGSIGAFSPIDQLAKVLVSQALRLGQTGVLFRACLRCGTRTHFTTANKVGGGGDAGVQVHLWRRFGA